jgi:apolipoprotein N-acyltransferase
MQTLSFGTQLAKMPRLKAPAKTRWLRLILAFGAGMLLAASFPRFNLRWLAWAAPGLILWTARGLSWKGSLGAGFTAGLGNYLVSLYWVLLIPFPWHALAGYLALCVVLSCYMAAWCWLCWYALRKYQAVSRVAWPLCCAMGWVTIEMLITRLFGGFPWNFLGASQIHFLPLIQIASVTGVYGVSFLVAWVSVAMAGTAWTWCDERRVSARTLAPVLVAVATTACVIFWGAERLSRPEDNDKAKIRIALVQPSIPQRTYWNAAEKTNRFLKLMELSRAALKSEPDLIIWPEAVMPDIFSRNGYLQASVTSLLQEHPAWMVMGATDTGPKAGASDADVEGHFNAAFLINPKGELVDRYYKRHLVPFGEYMPGAATFPFLGKLRSAGAGITPGRRTSAFQIGNPPAKFPVTICFEDVFPEEVRARVDADTDFILNLTSDAWFGESAAQWQHAESAALRAVENGVPLVRCCNNGLTCWIDARGRMHEIYFKDSDNIYAAGYKIVEVPLMAKNSRGRETYYSRHGDAFGWKCVALIITLCTFRLLVWRRKPGVRDA